MRVVQAVDGRSPLIPGWRRIGNWIDVGDGWLPWKLNNGTILVEPIVYVFHPKIVEMGAKLNVRAVASADGEVIDIVDGTTEFKAVAAQNGWLKVKWPMESLDAKANRDKSYLESELISKTECATNVQYIFAWVLMRTKQFELLVPKSSQSNWLIQEALNANEDKDMISNTSSPSGSPLSFHDSHISPLRLANINDERPLPTTLKRLKTRSISEDSIDGIQESFVGKGSSSNDIQQSK